MHLSFQASSKISSDWMFLELLRDPSKTWRVDMYGQALGEKEWLPLFSKVVGLSDEPFDREGVPSEGVSTEPPVPLVEPSKMPNEEMTAPLVEPWKIANAAMKMPEIVEGVWLLR